MRIFLSGNHRNFIKLKLQLSFESNFMFPFIILDIQRIDSKRSFNDRNSGNKIDSYPFFIFNLIVFIILNTNLSIYNLDHKGHFTTFLPFPVKNRKNIHNKEIFRFYCNLSTVQSLKLLDLVTVLVLADSLKGEGRLGQILELYWAWPDYVGWIYDTVLFCFVNLLIRFN